MSQRKQLVLSHLERVSWEVMDRYPKVLQSQIRGRWGIYALYKKDRLYYVGLAGNLSTRLKQHLRDRLRGKWDRFSVYLTVHDDHMKELESLILRIAVPSGNRTGGKFSKSRDLSRELNRLMTDDDANRRARLMGGKVVQRRQKQKARRAGIGALGGLLERRRELRAWRKGYQYRAYLRQDGTITYDGKVYESPTAAGVAAVKTRCNGWRFWHYRDAKREWVPLVTLRK